MSDQATPPAETGDKTSPYEGWPQWDCQLHRADASSEIFTVGVLHELRCSGDYIEKFQDPPEIVFADKKLEYSLKILRPIVMDHEKAHFLVTAYKPGDYQSVPYVVSDGFTGFRAKEMNWKVTSVIQQGAMQEPYGPIGPFSLSLPYWIWGALAALIFAIIFYTVRRLQKYQSRKKLLEELEAHTTALSPFNQFNRDLRLITRKYEGRRGDEKTQEYFLKVDEAFRLYLIREFKVPALDWSPRAIVSDLKGRHRILFNSHGEDLRRAIYEFDKAKKSTHKISAVDCQQLANLSRGLADRVHRFKKSHTKYAKEAGRMGQSIWDILSW